MARYGKAAGKSVKTALHREKRGTLRSGKGGKGGKVTSRKQAIAIGLSEARKKVPRSRKKILAIPKRRREHIWIRNSWDNIVRLLDSLAGKKSMRKDEPDEFIVWRIGSRWRMVSMFAQIAPVNFWMRARKELERLVRGSSDTQFAKLRIQHGKLNHHSVSCLTR
jgi:hypothetical protein